MLQNDLARSGENPATAERSLTRALAANGGAPPAMMARRAARATGRREAREKTGRRLWRVRGEKGRDLPGLGRAEPVAAARRPRGGRGRPSAEHRQAFVATLVARLGSLWDFSKNLN